MFRSAVAFAGLSLLWGSEWLVAAVIPSPPRLRWLALQYGLSALLLLPVVLSRGRLWRYRRRIPAAALAGVALLALPALALDLASARLPGGVLLASSAAVPLWIALAGRMDLPPALAGLGGVLLLAEPAMAVSGSKLLWLALAVAASVVTAAGLLLSERVAAALPPAELLLVEVAGSAAILWPVSLVAGGPMPGRSMAFVWALLLQSVFGVLLGYGLFFWLLRRAGAGIAGTLQWSQPLVAAAGSAVLLHARPGWLQIAGAGTIVASIVGAWRTAEGEQGVYLKITGPGSASAP